MIKIDMICEFIAESNTFYEIKMICDFRQHKCWNIKKNESSKK